MGAMRYRMREADKALWIKVACFDFSALAPTGCTPWLGTVKLLVPEIFDTFVHMMMKAMVAPLMAPCLCLPSTTELWKLSPHVHYEKQQQSLCGVTKAQRSLLHTERPAPNGTPPGLKVPLPELLLSQKMKRTLQMEHLSRVGHSCAPPSFPPIHTSAHVFECV